MKICFWNWSWLCASLSGKTTCTISPRTTKLMLSIKKFQWKRKEKNKFKIKWDCGELSEEMVGISRIVLCMHSFDNNSQVCIVMSFRQPTPLSKFLSFNKSDTVYAGMTHRDESNRIQIGCLFCSAHTRSHTHTLTHMQTMMEMNYWMTKWCNRNKQGPNEWAPVDSM